MIPCSLKAEDPLDNSANMSGNEEVISLSDIVPETNICFVSLTPSTAVTQLLIGSVYYFPIVHVLFFTVKQKSNVPRKV